MRYPKLLLAGILLLNAFNSYAEDHHVFVGAGGNTPGISMNYEYKFSKNLWGGVGLGYYHGKPFGNDVSVTSIGVPVFLNALWFEGEHKLETGAGVTYISSAAEDSFNSLTAEGAAVLPVFSFGYRYMPTNGLTFRAVVSPVVTDSGLRFGLGFGLGFAF